jgi:Zn-dependent protease with chaperone function
MKKTNSIFSLFKKTVAVTVGASLLTGCVSTTSMGHGSERKQFILFSQHGVEKAANKAVLKNEKKGNKKTVRSQSSHSPSEVRVINIMNQLMPYAESYLKNDRNIKWDAIIYSAKKDNVGIMANGTVIITQSFVNHSALSDDNALAYILAHEMAHVVRSHHREMKTWSYTFSPALLTTAYLTSGATAYLAAYGHSGLFNRKLEKEADLLGLEIMSKAGFDPVQAVTVFKKYEPTFKKDHPIMSYIPTIIKKHPSFSSRTKYSENALDKVTPLYLQSKESIAPTPRNPIPSNPIQPIIVKNMVQPEQKPKLDDEKDSLNADLTPPKAESMAIEPSNVQTQIISNH